MPIEFYKPTGELNTGRYADPEVPANHRHFYITDKDGVEVEIRSQTQLNEILAQMTPDELALWKIQYRFTPILNGTKNPGYSGGPKDV